MSEEQNLKGLEEVDIEVTGQIDLPTIDVKKYIGNKAKIERAVTVNTQYGYSVLLETGTVDEIGEGEQKFVLKASRLFGLQKDKDGKIGWGKHTALGVYLAKMDVEHYKDLVGREVVIQSKFSMKMNRDVLTIA